MILSRAIVAGVLFFFAVIGVIDLFSEPFSWISLGITIALFYVAHLIWPSKKKHQRENDNILFDILEFFIELPFELFAKIFRGGSRSRDGDGDVDFFDVDL